MLASCLYARAGAEVPNNRSDRRLCTMVENPTTYDYIIVGAGSAGCALAYRLSRESSRRVLLLEAGGKDNLPLIHIPLGFAFLMKNPKVNWCYETEADPNMHHRRIAWRRGKGLGGSSCINGMVYIRGQREDYDYWSELGNTGWSYDCLLYTSPSPRA